MTSARLNRNNPVSNPAGGERRGISGPSLAPPTQAPIRLPYVEEALIAHLEEVFRFTPSSETSLREMDRAVGHQAVITHLRSLHDAQEDNTL